MDSKTSALEYIYFYPTSYCNLNCLHCWISPVYIKQNKAPEEAPFCFIEGYNRPGIAAWLKECKDRLR